MMERAQRGHNSRHYAEELREDIETVLSDDHEKLFHFAKWHIDDYIAGTVGMKLEAEGAYIRFLMRLYQRGKPLPDDDRFMAIAMNLSIRVWKRIKDSLISIGKIVRKAGCLTNPRFEKERKARAEQLRKQAEAARKRWERERAEKASKPEVSPKFDGSLDEVSPKLSQSASKKSNGINGAEGNQPDITRVSKRLDSKKDSVPDGTGAEAPPPEKSLREMIWDEGIAWLRPRACMSEAKLRGQVGRWAKDHDPGFVLNAIAVAQKENPVSVMPYIEGVLRRGPTMTVNGKRLAPWEAEALERERREDAALEELREYEKTLNRERV